MIQPNRLWEGIGGRRSRNVLRKIADVVLPRSGSSLKHPPDIMKPACPYFFSLCSAIAKSGWLRIVVVGANDGRINDPIYSFASRYRRSTEVFLIEPQTSLLPYLAGNYQFHPRAKVCNVAIGNPGFITLYSVNSSLWPHLRVDYARDWPVYRAPTGVASGDRRHVRRWLQKYAPKGVDVDAMIAKEQVESVPLPQVLRTFGAVGDIDVLQVDTEGMDDVVIFNSGIDELNPSIIYFEAENLSKDRFDKVATYLEERHYVLGRCGRDVLAVLASESVSNLQTGD